MSLPCFEIDKEQQTRSDEWQIQKSSPTSAARIEISPFAGEAGSFAIASIAPGVRAHRGKLDEDGLLAWALFGVVPVNGFATSAIVQQLFWAGRPSFNSWRGKTSKPEPELRLTPEPGDCQEKESPDASRSRPSGPTRSGV